MGQEEGGPGGGQTSPTVLVSLWPTDKLDNI